jgi:hypothetical protein
MIKKIIGVQGMRGLDWYRHKEQPLQGVSGHAFGSTTYWVVFIVKPEYRKAGKPVQDPFVAAQHESSEKFGL